MTKKHFGFIYNCDYITLNYNSFSFFLLLNRINRSKIRSHSHQRLSAALKICPMIDEQLKAILSCDTSTISPLSPLCSPLDELLEEVLLSVDISSIAVLLEEIISGTIGLGTLQVLGSTGTIGCGPHSSFLGLSL